MFWVAYLEENSDINAVNFILFSFFLANTQLLSASLYQIYKSSGVQVGPVLAHLAGAITTLPSCLPWEAILPSSHGDWVARTQQRLLNGWPVFAPACPPPQPFRVMAQSASLLSGIIVLARGEHTWRWNCFSVKVFCSNLEVPGQSLQVPSPELERRRERWRWQPSKMAKKEDHFGLGQPKPVYSRNSCATVENCLMILCLGFLKMKDLVF